MKNNILKKEHPQKYWLKMICDLLYYLGLGECWYEERHPSRFQKYYRIWSIISNLFIFIVLADELLSNFRDDLTLKEKNDLLQLSIAHPIICTKIVSLYLKRDRVRMILKRLLEDSRDVFPSSTLDRDSVRKAKLYFLVTSSVVYLTVFATTVDAVMTHIKEGIPIRTEVTFYPSKNNSGLFVNILRFFVQFHWWYIISIMLLIDGLSIFSLTFIGFKFRRVRLYFESLGGRFSKKSQRKPTAAECKEFWKEFVVGIELHEDALWCARNVQHALGVFYSVQVVESIGLLVISLFKLVAEETTIHILCECDALTRCRSFTLDDFLVTPCQVKDLEPKNILQFILTTMESNFSLILANLAFISGLVVVTGAYMLDAADITYEASLVSTAIFHCGWEHVAPQSGFRTLVVIAIQRSQVPVYMTAFGVIVLSYSNFITVLRSSYSFFAVMY